MFSWLSGIVSGVIISMGEKRMDVFGDHFTRVPYVSATLLGTADTDPAHRKRTASSTL